MWAAFCDREIALALAAVLKPLVQVVHWHVN
jgi:hypothetical protein